MYASSRRISFSLFAFNASGVHLGGGRQHHAGSLARHRPQHHLRAHDVRLDRLDRPLEDQADAHGRCQVVDDVDLVDQLLDERLV